MNSNTIPIASVAERLLSWARRNHDVLAMYWYGSFSTGRSTPDSDLDAALLLDPKADVAMVQQQIRTTLGEDVRLALADAHPNRVTCFLGPKLLKVECMLATNPEELAWLADSDDVPAPRLVLACERDGAGQLLLTRAARPCKADATSIANQEIEKFLEGFEACSRAHHRSDAYGFYFHYNLALGRLARLVQISRHQPERLYLPPQLTNTRLRLEERRGFIELASTLYLPEANAAKRRLVAEFLRFTEELGSRLTLTRQIGELKSFLEAVLLRDHFWNVRDWADLLDGRVHPGVLIRASTLTRWQGESELDQWLRNNHVQQIIDLRGDQPRDGAPYKSDILQLIRYSRHPIVQATPMDQSDRAPHYLDLALNNLPTIVAVLNQLAEADACSVVHCYAGVDRTGVVMALLGDLLELPHDSLLRDYVASAADLYAHSMAIFLEGITARGGAWKLLSDAGLEESVVVRLRERLLIAP